jgi:hypothetical protein
MAFVVKNTNLKEKFNLEQLSGRATRDVERMTQGSESIEDDLMSKIHQPVIMNHNSNRPPSVKDSKIKLPALA